MPFKPFHISKIRCSLLVLLFALIIKPITVSSQQFIYENFTVDDGLPSSECYDVIQDQKGYIWVATDKGIAKYNGQTFKVFNQESGLKSSVVFRLFEKNGRIWFFTYNKWLQYIEGDSVVTPAYSEKLRGVIDSLRASPGGLSVNWKNEVLVSLEQKDLPHNYLKIDSNKFILIRTFSKKNRSSITLIQENSFKNLMSTNFDDLNGKYSKFSFLKVNNGEVDSEIVLKDKVKGMSTLDGLSIVTEPNGITIVNALNALYLIKNNKVNKCAIKNTLSGSIIKAEPNVYFIGLMSGSSLVKFKVKNDSIVIEDSTSHKLNRVSGGVMDSENGLWISSLSKGLFYAKNYNLTELNSIVSDSPVIGIGNVESNIYVATNNNEVQVIKSKSLKYEKKIKIEREIYSLSEMRRSIVIVSSMANQKFMNDIRNKNGYGDVFCSEDTLWRAGKGYVYWVAQDNVEYKSQFEKELLKPYKSIYKKNEWVYLGTLDGLLKLNLKEKYVLDEKEVNVQIDYRLNDIIGCANNVLLATNGSGLTIIDNNDSIISTINKSNGLSSNFCNSIYKQNDSTFWVSTNKGVSQVVFNLKSDSILYSIKVINKSHGLLSNEVTHCLVAENRLFIGTKKGLCYMDLKYDFSNKTPPPVFIEKLIVSDSLMDLSKTQQFEYNQNNFHFYFAGLTYKTRGKYRFRYRLIKDKNENVYSDIDQPSVQFADLSPGNYTFEVVALNNDNLPSENPAIYSFQISPPLWGTWWFRLIFLLVFVAIVYSLIKYRNYEIKTKNELNLKTKQLKQQALNAQLNPHFIFNTMGSIQSLIMDRKLPEAEGYLTKFSKMLRVILSTSEEHFSKLISEVDLVMEYVKLENLRFDNRIELILNIQKSTSKETFNVPTLLILTLVENAILHGILPSKKKGRIIISAHIDENDSSRLLISIEDNGIGINQSRKTKKEKIDRHKSKGLNIIKDRLNTYSSLYQSKFSIKFIDVSDEDENRSGTRVEILTPFRIFRK